MVLQTARSTASCWWLLFFVVALSVFNRSLKEWYYRQPDQQLRVDDFCFLLLHFLSSMGHSKNGITDSQINSFVLMTFVFCCCTFCLQWVTQGMVALQTKGFFYLVYPDIHFRILFYLEGYTIEVITNKRQQSLKKKPAVRVRLL